MINASESKRCLAIQSNHYQGFTYSPIRVLRTQNGRVSTFSYTNINNYVDSYSLSLDPNSAMEEVLLGNKRTALGFLKVAILATL